MTCSRQAGKSTTAAAIALKTALLKPGALVLLLSPSLRQSSELFGAKLVPMLNALGRPVPVVQESALRLLLGNGSRVVSLPGDEGNIRGFSAVDLLIIDEAARTEEALYLSVRPMLAVSGGRLIALSTPHGKAGWYWREWAAGAGWRRVSVTAHDCPRIPKDFLAQEERSMGPRWFRQEYLNSFEDAVDSVFAYADIQAALATDLQPLFPVR
jgi:hypothetical protein